MNQAAHERFLCLQSRLATLHPDAVREATALASSTVDPRTADAEAIWRVLWDKPLFANARVAVAGRWVAGIEAEMQGAWRTWGADPGVFNIRRVRPGVKRECFEVQGALALGFVARHRIALHRLHRIQGAAAALRVRGAPNPHPFADLVGKPLSVVIPALQREFGSGWGVVTVLHALTDMGLAVKPDLHLVTTMRFLKLSEGISDRKVPDLRDAVRINEGVRALLSALGRPDTSFELRFIDKVLMDLSHRGMLR